MGIPVLVTRETTERPEAVAAGTARLVGTDTLTLVAAVECLLHDPSEYRKMAQAHNPYGDGSASRRIVQTLTAVLQEARQGGHALLDPANLKRVGTQLGAPEVVGAPRETT